MSTAVISLCEKYRYELERHIYSDYLIELVVFVMLNPSTADAEIDDPTIRRCIGFAERYSPEHMRVVNLYAGRATKPKDLWLMEDPVGPDNDRHVVAALEDADLVICAWGANARRDQVDHFLKLAGDKPLYCLGTTNSGMPRHPLMLRNDTELETFND